MITLNATLPASSVDVGEMIATRKLALTICRAPGPVIPLHWVPEIRFPEGLVLFAIPHRLVRDPSGLTFTRGKTEASFLVQGLTVQGAQMASGQARNAKRQEASQWRQEVACRLWPHMGM